MTPSRLVSVFFLTAGLLLAVPVHAQNDAAKDAETVASRLMEAHGSDAFASMPYLRFDFAVAGGGQTQVVSRNLWDRQNGVYRVETSSENGPVVTLIDVDASSPGNVSGKVYRDGSEVTGDDGQKLVEQGYQRFINDTYWLLAPLKVMDPGVTRTYLPDSSTAEHDVLHLTFGDVGLTPDDEYWLYVDAETGQLNRWAFRLQGMDDDAQPAVFDWADYVTLQAPDGEVRLAETHASVTGNRDLLTNNLSAPASVPDDTLRSPTPVLE